VGETSDMRNDRSTLRHLLATYLRPQRGRVGLLTILLLGSTGLQLLNPQIVRRFIDSATGSNPAAIPALVQLALLFIAVALLAQGVTVWATYLSEKVGWSATNALRSDLARHCLKLDLRFHRERTPGEMIERIDGDITAISTLFSQFVIRIVGSLLVMIGVLVLLFREDWRVGLALTLFTLIATAILIRSRDIAVPALKADREAQARLFGFVEERLAGLDDLRANGGGNYTMNRMYIVLRDVFAKTRRGILMGSTLWMITNGLFALGYALALGLGGWLYLRNAVTIGTVYLFFDYVYLLRQPIQQIAEQLKEFQKAFAGIERVGELYALDPQVVDGDGPRIPPGAIEVEFDRVGFAYDDQPVIRDLSFSLAAGQVLGLLGRTGSGKTTLTRLLFRLYDIDGGAIRLNGVSVRDTTLADLRQDIGIVTQDVQLFSASVRDNLTLFNTGIPDARLIEILEDVGLGTWLHALPDGLDTGIEPGSLSAGEAQLLAFARVFLRDPGLVILDEASSRLDPATERLIERAIDKLLRPHGRRRTAIIIAHRLSTVERADHILILEDGQKLEYGPRHALLNDEDSRFAHLLRTGMEEVLA
jgi:ATP-binding cassette, subfamily B, bacterial